MAHIYCERQRGGLCRLHALNNFLGRQQYSEQDFKALCTEYNKVYGFQPDCRDWDTVDCNQEPVFGYVLRTRHGLGGIIYYQGKTWSGDARLDELVDPDVERKVFVYDSGHVWVAQRTTSNTWIKIDSIGGVSECKQPQPNLFYYIPLATDAMRKTQELIRSYVTNVVPYEHRHPVLNKRVACQLLTLPHNFAKIELGIGLYYKFEQMLNKHNAINKIATQWMRKNQTHRFSSELAVLLWCFFA